MNSQNVSVRIELPGPMVGPFRQALVARGHNSFADWVQALVASYLLRNWAELETELGDQAQVARVNAELTLQRCIDRGVERP